MLHHSTKDAIKLALSFSIAISLTFLFGWEKPWWSAITIIVIAVNETYGQSIKLAKQRLLGTLLGAGLALVLINFLAQEPFLFITIYILLAGIATFMSFNLKSGYVFRMAFTVLSIVCAMGNFNDIASFNVIILRLQETILGIVVYSVVFSLVWPNTTQDYFFNLHKNVLSSLEDKVNQLSQKLSAEDAHKLISELEQTITQIAKMKTILDLPLNGSHKLKNQLEKWRAITISSYEIKLKLTEIANNCADNDADQTKIQTDLSNLKQQLATLSSASKSDDRSSAQITVDRHWDDLKKLTLEVPMKIRLINAALVLVMITICFSLWIYIPLITGGLFPLLSAILSVTFMTMPKGLMKDVILATVILSAFILLQYVFIMPSFTELWQLVAFYFINIIVICKVYARPEQIIYKILGCNFLVLFTTGALHLTPTFTIEMPLNMLIQICVVLGIIHFFEKISRSLGC